MVISPYFFPYLMGWSVLNSKLNHTRPQEHALFLGTVARNCHKYCLVLETSSTLRKQRRRKKTPNNSSKYTGDSSCEWWVKVWEVWAAQKAAGEWRKRRWQCSWKEAHLAWEGKQQQWQEGGGEHENSCQRSGGKWQHKKEHNFTRVTQTG